MTCATGTRRRRTPRARRLIRPAGLGLLLGTLVGSLLALAGPASPAAAHAFLNESDPADGAVVDTAPERVTLTFSEPVRPVPDRVLAVGPDGERVDAGEPSAEGPVLTVPLEATDARGTYLVSFRVISADSHPVSGALTFSVGAPSQTPPLPGGGGAGDGIASTALSVVKYFGYAGVVLVVGPAVVLAGLWPRRLSRRGPARLLWTGAGVVAVTTLLSLWLQVPYATGQALSLTAVADVPEVLGTTAGRAHLVRLAVLAAAVWLLRPLVAGRATRSDLLLAGALGVVGLGTWPMSGHAVSAPLPAVAVASGTVHLAAAALWAGGLLMLAMFVLPRADARERGAILPVWSGWAAGSVGLVVLAGAVRALLETGSVEAALTTGYGRLLLVKLGLVAAALAVATGARRLVRHRLAVARAGTLRAVVAVEAGLLAVVLGLSAGLVQTTPARTEAAGPLPSVAADYLSTTVDSELYSLEVIVDPAAVGTNTVHLIAYTHDGDPLPVVEWDASASLPEAGVEGLEIPLERVSDNHAVGDVTLPVGGEWRFRFAARISEIDRAAVLVPVSVAGSGDSS